MRTRAHGNRNNVIFAAMFTPPCEAIMKLIVHQSYMMYETPEQLVRRYSLDERSAVPISVKVNKYAEI